MGKLFRKKISQKVTKTILRMRQLFSTKAQLSYVNKADNLCKIGKKQQYSKENYARENTQVEDG